MCNVASCQLHITLVRYLHNPTVKIFAFHSGANIRVNFYENHTLTYVLLTHFCFTYVHTRFDRNQHLINCLKGTWNMYAIWNINVTAFWENSAATCNYKYLEMSIGICHIQVTVYMYSYSRYVFQWMYISMAC